MWLRLRLGRLVAGRPFDSRSRVVGIGIRVDVAATLAHDDDRHERDAADGNGCDDSENWRLRLLFRLPPRVAGDARLARFIRRAAAADRQRLRFPGARFRGRRWAVDKIQRARGRGSGVHRRFVMFRRRRLRRRAWRGGGRRRGRSSLSQFRPQPLVVFFLLFRTKQTNLGRRNLVQQLLRQLGMLARLQRPQVDHPLVGRGLDHVRIAFERIDRKQPIVVGRLLGGRDAKPLVIRVELRCHRAPSSRRMFRKSRARAEKMCCFSHYAAASPTPQGLPGRLL